MCILSVVIFNTNYRSLDYQVKVVIMTQTSGMDPSLNWTLTEITLGDEPDMK